MCVLLEYFNQGGVFRGYSQAVPISFSNTHTKFSIKNAIAPNFLLRHAEKRIYWPA